MALSTSEWPGAEIEIAVKNFNLYIACFVVVKNIFRKKSISF